MLEIGTYLVAIIGAIILFYGLNKLMDKMIDWIEDYFNEDIDEW